MHGASPLQGIEKKIQSSIYTHIDIDEQFSVFN